MNTFVKQGSIGHGRSFSQKDAHLFNKTKEVPNLHLFKITQVPSSTIGHPERIQILSERFKEQVFIPRGTAERWYEEAIQYLRDKEFNIIGQAEGMKHMYVISDTFEPLKK